MATIKQVAALADVSTATVSRVLNGNYPVSKDAKEKVMKAIKELGYRPNMVAKSLKMNRTYMIGVVVPDISNPYFMEIARGIEEVVSHFGYTITFCSTDEDKDKEIRLLKALNEKRMDYVVLASCLKDEKPLQELMNQGLNIIMVDTILPNLDVDFIVEDNEHLSYQIVDYAISQGHQKIGIVNGIMDISTARDRYNGYLKALEDNHIPIEDRYSIDGGYYRDIAYQNVKKMLQQNLNDLPTLLYTTNNQMTEGAMIALKEFDFKVPEDISIISFGEITLSQLIEPKLTVIKQNSIAIGEKAGEIIIKRMENEEFKDPTKLFIIESEFVVRNSVKHLNE